MSVTPAQDLVMHADGTKLADGGREARVATHTRPRRPDQSGRYATASAAGVRANIEAKFGGTNRDDVAFVICPFRVARLGDGTRGRAQARQLQMRGVRNSERRY